VSFDANILQQWKHFKFKLHMKKIVKISPYKKDFSGTPMNTQEKSLANHGYIRSPGTKKTITPKREVDGRYRTGVDVNANYIKALPPEEQEAEKKLIEEILEELQGIFPQTDFSNRSKVWQAYSEEEIKVNPVKLSNGDVILNLDNVDDLLTYAWLRVHPEIAKSGEAIRLGQCRDCQYYIADDEAENRVVYSKKKLINKAIVDFEALTPTKRRQVARLLGLPVTDETKEEAIYNIVDNFLKKPEFEKGSAHEGKNTINVFNEILALSDDRLYTKDLVEEAIRHNIYRTKGDVVMEGNEVIASTKDELVNNLLDKQKELLALEKRVKSKKIAAL